MGMINYLRKFALCLFPRQAKLSANKLDCFRNFNNNFSVPNNQTDQNPQQLCIYLTLSSIHTHINTLKKTNMKKTVWEKVKLLKIPTFQLLSAVSLNLGRSQNEVLGNGLNLSLKPLK